MLFHYKISVGSPDFGGRTGRGLQPRTLAGKQHTIRVFTQAVHFGWHRLLMELLRGQNTKMATGGAEPLAREQKTGARGNLPSAGAEADSCEGLCSGKRQDRQNLLEMALLCSPGLSPSTALLLVAGPCTGPCPTTSAGQADSTCPCVSLRRDTRGSRVHTTLLWSLGII